MEAQPSAITISIVIPVYKGEATLTPLVHELEPLAAESVTPEGKLFRVAEVVLVCDGAIDGSPIVMEALQEKFSFVRLIWLARNFGQHAATLAGAAESGVVAVARVLAYPARSSVSVAVTCVPLAAVYATRTAPALAAHPASVAPVSATFEHLACGWKR